MSESLVDPEDCLRQVHRSYQSVMDGSLCDPRKQSPLDEERLHEVHFRNGP